MREEDELPSEQREVGVGMNQTKHSPAAAERGEEGKEKRQGDKPPPTHPPICQTNNKTKKKKKKKKKNQSIYMHAKSNPPASFLSHPPTHPPS